MTAFSTRNCRFSNRKELSLLFEELLNGIAPFFAGAESALLPVLMDLTELIDSHVCHTR